MGDRDGGVVGDPIVIRHGTVRPRQPASPWPDGYRFEVGGRWVTLVIAVPPRFAESFSRPFAASSPPLFFFHETTKRCQPAGEVTDGGDPGEASRHNGCTGDLLPRMNGVEGRAREGGGEGQ